MGTTISSKPSVLGADLFGGDVVIEFHDGKIAVYSSTFLYASLPNAHELPSIDENFND